MSKFIKNEQIKSKKVLTDALITKFLLIYYWFHCNCNGDGDIN